LKTPPYSYPKPLEVGIFTLLNSIEEYRLEETTQKFFVLALRRLTGIIYAEGAKIMKYIHQLPDWPDFRWDIKKLANLLAQTRHKQGRLLGRMNSLGFEIRTEAGLETLTQNIVKSGEIEGDHLDFTLVRSSLARRLGIDLGGVSPVSRHIDGVVEMMLDATLNYLQTTG
jgi:hypothetical protein